MAPGSQSESATLAELGASLSSNRWTLYLQGGISNLFGLDILSGYCILGGTTAINPTNGIPFTPEGPLIEAGGSINIYAATIYGYYSQVQTPSLANVGYYFAPLINPNLNTMNLPPVNQQPSPLPIDDTFNVTNQTPLIVGAVGQPMIIGAWAKYSISNSSPTKFAYLGQYFVTNAFLLDASGNATTNLAGIVSPYGEFFPTQAGRAQLITMQDIDTGQQGTNIVQIVSLNVDANHDGMMDLSYFGQDQTSPNKPYVFWCNNNFDRWHAVDFATDTEQDDLQQGDAGLYNLDPNDPDYNYTVSGSRVIPCTRDLEDFSRLWINGVTSNLLAALPSGSTITLNWGDVGNPNSGNPTIDLFAAADTDGGIGYLTNSTIAAEQTNITQCPYIGRLAPGGSLQLNTIQFNNWAGNYFIWCGVGNGSGKLNLTFADASGNLLGQASVYIQIMDIKQMYERWTVGDNPYATPASTAYIAEDNLFPGESKFQYTSPVTTNTPYILFVHGWNMPTWEKDRYAETAFKRLYWQGYQGRFGEFRWPTYYNFLLEAFQWQAIDLNNFDNSELNGWNSATGLANLLTTLNAENPGQVYLMAHSLGNIVVGEALRLAGTNQVVNTYVAMQAAISAHAYDPSTVNRTTSVLPDDYAHYWTSNAPCYFNGIASAGTFVNFFNTNDYALNVNNWQLDQDLKPHLGYGYSNSGNFWYSGLTELSYTADRYTIFAFCDPSWSYALGAQQNVGGAFTIARQVELDAAPYNFGREHLYHSGEFRSDNTQRWQFWNQVLVQMKLKLQ